MHTVWVFWIYQRYLFTPNATWFRQVPFKTTMTRENNMTSARIYIILRFEVFVFCFCNFASLCLTNRARSTRQSFTYVSRARRSGVHEIITPKASKWRGEDRRGTTKKRTVVFSVIKTPKHTGDLKLSYIPVSLYTTSSLRGTVHFASEVTRRLRIVLCFYTRILFFLPVSRSVSALP